MKKSPLSLSLIAGLLLSGSGLVLLVIILLSGMSYPASAAPPQHGTPAPDATPHVHAADYTGEDAPTYFEDVEPIIAANCVACHSPGQIGYPQYAIDTYQDVVAAVDDLAYYVGIRYMPPWPPAGSESPAFQHDRSLSEHDIATILAWAEAGAPLGNPQNRRAAALTPPPQLNAPAIRPDRVLMPPAPYTPDASDGLDAYRCFLLDPGFETDTYITGYQLVPGAPEIAHHIIAYKAHPRVRAQAQEKAAQDGQPGWDCYGGTGLSGGSGGFTTSVGDWGPGTGPRPHAPGTGQLMEAGSLIVMQVHYNLEAGSQPDQTRLVLEVSPGDAGLHPLRTLPLLAPVEIPCPAGVTGPACQRDYALQHADSGIAEWLFWRCRKTEADYTRQPDGEITSFCDYTAFETGYIVRVAGHMHELGTRFRIKINPGTAAAQPLLDIPVWDFDWQSDYLLTEPIPIQRGDTVRITCTWDNSETTRYIVWGERTADEMCLGRIIYVPADGLDVAAFLQAYIAAQEASSSPAK